MNDGIEIANIALLLGLVIIVVANWSWKIGILLSLFAATALNYFATEPIHSLRVTSRDDLITITLMTLLGLTVSTLTVLRTRKKVLNSQNSQSNNLRQSLNLFLGQERSSFSIMKIAFEIIGHDLDLLNIKMSHQTDSSLPTVTRPVSSHETESEVVVIPATGAFIRFVDPRLAAGLIVTPQGSLGALEVPRDLLFLLVNHIEVLLKGTL